MTPEFGAASQLEKIDMLDFADVVAINKFERRGAADALRDVGRQLVRNREAFGKRPEDMPVFGTSAATFNDDGVTALYQHLRALLAEHGLDRRGRRAPARRRAALLRHLRQVVPPTGCATSPRSPRPSAATTPDTDELRRAGPTRRSGSTRSSTELDARGRGRPRARREARTSAADWRRRGRRASTTYSGDELRSCPSATRSTHDHPGRESLSGNRIPRVSLPALRRPRRARAVLPPREPPGPLPVHRGRLPVQARQRGPGADVRRRGRPVPHQPPVQAALRGPAGRPGCPRRSTR